MKMNATTLRVSFLVASVALTSASALADGEPIAWWQADGNANDSSGNGYNGSLEGSTWFGSGVFGGQAFEFGGAGSGDYVSVPSSGTWGFGSGSFTVNVWAQFEGFGNGYNGGLGDTFVGQDAGQGYYNKWVFFYNFGSDQLGFHLNGSDSQYTWMYSPETVDVVPGEWNMFTVTRSGSTYTFYFDGSEVGTQTSDANVPYSGSDLTIGQAEGLGWFDGGITDVSIWGEALSGSQVESLYRNNSVTPSPAAALPLMFGVGAMASRRRKR
jgi:hypothetical protein